MEYCFLGNSGLQVARLGLGAIPFGTTLDEKTSQRIVDMYRDAGGNLIDTSNLYGGGFRGTNTAMAGTSEMTVGKMVAGKREKFVIATKGYWLMGDDVRPNSVGLSRTYLTKEIENSLNRLNTDYIDLYQCHAWDFYTPLDETLRVLDDFVRAGKIRYIGVSNWDGWHVMKASTIARFTNLTAPISNQIWYNLADRGAEHSIIPACRDAKVSTIAWGAMAQGFLTGRYRRGVEKPVLGSRFEQMKPSESSSWENLAIERNWATLDVLARIAECYDNTIPNVATRWMIQAGTSDVVLLGGSRLEQYSNLLESLRFQLSDDEVNELREVSEPPHPYPRNCLDLFCRRDSEFYGGLR